MPTISITLPYQRFQKVKERARTEGFKNPTSWARFLIERNIALEESPKLKSSLIVSEMRKTGLYQEEFLRDLKKSIIYADRAA